jgi:type IV secretion system protein VirB10
LSSSGPPTGRLTRRRFLLIPQGSKLVGLYDSQISFGQDGVMLVWTRLVMPNGRSIVLERQPGADPQGFAGLRDEVDQHWDRLGMAAALSTLLGVGAEPVQPTTTAPSSPHSGAAPPTASTRPASRWFASNRNIQPTITIRPGFPVRVIVDRDLVLAPYHDSRRVSKQIMHQNQ